MVSKRHIGCQVVAVEWDGDHDLRGLTGILKAITDDGDHGLVEYPTKIGSASADGLDQHGNHVAKPGYCYWHRRKYLKEFKTVISYGKKVKEDFEYRGRNLKGMPFRFIGALPSQEHAVVEFDENIGGHSADGHGKKGHCLVVPAEVIKK